jgi:signal transduction histidine kinase
VGIGLLGTQRIYRFYDYSAEESRFRRIIDALLIGSGLFALLAVALGYRMAGRLVRQLAGLAGQVDALTVGAAPRRVEMREFDESEVSALALAFNHHLDRIDTLLTREKEFTGDISHELRTPVTAIRTTCELLLEDAALPPHCRLRVERIDHAAGLMAEQIAALLLLARNETLPPTALDLQALMDDVLGHFGESIAARKLRIELDLAPAGPVAAHRAPLLIVLSNLVDNAVKHSPSGGVVRIEATGREIRIRDAGPGIADGELPRVFERHFRGGQASTDAVGHGLGLSIVSKICARFGWRLAIVPAEPCGTLAILDLGAGILHENLTSS